MITLGIDEVGRGCIAGPLVVGAVILSEEVEGLMDSKLLSPLKREKLANIINNSALYASLGWVSSDELDKIGLPAALVVATQRATKNLKIKVDEIIIDGNVNFLSNLSYSKTIIKADNFIPCVSAASIIAKVARDEFMRRLSASYPYYNFEANKGYGSLAHMKAIKEYGFCSIHRKSFEPIKSML